MTAVAQLEQQAKYHKREINRHRARLRDVMSRLQNERDRLKREYGLVLTIQDGEGEIPWPDQEQKQS